ncbi:MAG: hypothetical protein L6V85_06685 [Clostridiales bacterium]|nr:MAG: hypothetical protein L6V85_06685 [Clostridiales bacterium]
MRGKAQIKSAFVFGLETSIGNMNLLGKHALLTGEVADVEELIGKIDAVTPEDVRKSHRRELRFVKGDSRIRRSEN